jgi:hypothetical protein
MSSKIQPGVGYTFQSESKGFSLQIDQPGRRRHPLEVYSNPNNGSPAVSVWPGTVNGVMPKISATYLDATTRPKLSVGSTGFIYVKVTRASGEVFPKTVDVEFASTVPADTSTTGYFTIATVEKTGNSLKINQVISSSLIVGRQAYGASAAFFYWFNV